MTSPGLANFKVLLDATSQRRREIVDESARAKRQLIGAHVTRALAWATLISAVIPAARRATGRALATRRQELATLTDNLSETSIKVDFDLESEVGPPHRRMQEAFDAIAASASAWTLRSTQMIDRVRARASYGTVVDRTPTSLGRGSHPLVATSEAPPVVSVQNGQASAYFYAGFVMVADRTASEFALIDRVDLQVNATTGRFTETEMVPRDAAVIDSAWAKSNKDGSRDRRFRDNMQLPVCLYGDLSITGPGGLNERLMFSRERPCHAFVSALNEVRALLASSAKMTNVQRRKIIGSS